MKSENKNPDVIFTDTAILNIFAVDNPRDVGLQEMTPTGPAGVRFGLAIPSDKDKQTSLVDILEILNSRIVKNEDFTWEISYIQILPGDYSEESKDFLLRWLDELPVTGNCQVNLPFEIVWG